jgi:hypothetical protein
LPFCAYLPFEQGLVLCLNKLYNPSCKDNMNQVWLKSAYLFWRAFDSFQYKDNCKDGVILLLSYPSPEDHDFKWF